MLPVAVNVPIGGGGFVLGGGGGGGGGGTFLESAARAAVVAKTRLSTTGMMSRSVLIVINSVKRSFIIHLSCMFDFWNRRQGPVNGHWPATDLAIASGSRAHWRKSLRLRS